jgi:hypothetical protein
VKPNINSVEVHPQLSNNRHPVDGELVGCWFTVALAYSKAINVLHNGLATVYFIPIFVISQK